MARMPLEQLKTALTDARSVLITFPHTHGAHLETLDCAAGALALAHTLEHMGKRVDITADGFTPHASFTVLADTAKIKPLTPPLHRVIVSMPISHDATVDHDIRGNEIHIAITPTQGTVDHRNVRIRTTQFHYDTVIVIGALELHALGSIYRDHSDFLANTLLINLDYRLANEGYGSINYIDHTASAHAETVSAIIESLNPHALNDSRIATMLLAGILAATRSFRNTRVRPQSLATASRLITMGADREYVMQSLFRTRSVATLKLWGIALANLTHDTEIGLVSTIITSHDFNNTHTTPNELTDVIHELLLASGEADKALIVYEGTDSAVHGILLSNRVPPELLLHSEPPTHATARHELQFRVTGKRLDTVRAETVQKIKSACKQ